MDSHLPEELLKALDEASRARMRHFWKNEATVPAYLLKSVAFRGTAYPKDTESGHSTKGVDALSRDTSTVVRNINR